MTGRNSILRFFAMFLAIITISNAAQGQNGVSKFKDVNAPGAMETDTYAVNNFGVIAGDYVDSSQVQHGMILNGKSLTTVDRAGCLTTPGHGAIALFGLTSKQVAIGWCFDTNQQTEVAFEYNHGRITPITISGAVSVQAQGINDAGQVVGAYLDEAGLQHGFLLTGAKLTRLDVPGHNTPAAWSINNRGLISIYAINNNSGHHDSFLTTNGRTYTTVNVRIPGVRVTDSLIHGLNNPISTDSADRVYTYIDSSGQEHGAMFVKGVYYSFNDPNDKKKNTTQGYGLNDKLEIIGDYLPGALHSPTAGVNQGFSAYGCCR
jgi:probable HAF family extracellular repeat protein